LVKKKQLMSSGTLQKAFIKHDGLSEKQFGQYGCGWFGLGLLRTQLSRLLDGQVSTIDRNKNESIDVSTVRLYETDHSVSFLSQYYLVLQVASFITDRSFLMNRFIRMAGRGMCTSKKMVTSLVVVGTILRFLVNFEWFKSNLYGHLFRPVDLIAVRGAYSQQQREEVDSMVASVGCFDIALDVVRHISLQQTVTINSMYESLLFTGGVDWVRFGRLVINGTEDRSISGSQSQIDGLVNSVLLEDLKQLFFVI